MALCPKRRLEAFGMFFVLAGSDSLRAVGFACALFPPEKGTFCRAKQGRQDRASLVEGLPHFQS